MQLVSVAVPKLLNRPPPIVPAELPLTVQLVSVAVPTLLNRPPPRVAGGGVAADGAVGQRGRAAIVVAGRRRWPVAEPPVIVSPEIDAVTPASTWNTRLAPLPLTVTPAAGPVIVSVPVVSLSSSWRRLRVIVCGVVNTVGSKLIVSAPPVEFAWPIAQRSVPERAVVERVGHGERGQQPAVLQRQQ